MPFRAGEVNVAAIADAVWTRGIRQLSDVDNVKAAISADVWAAPTRKLTSATIPFVYPSANLIASADTLRWIGSTSYTKAKEMKVRVSGKYRVVFSITSSWANEYVRGRIYKNGVAYGTERRHWYGTDGSYTEDLEFNAGDTIELWGLAEVSGNSVGLYNFRVYGTLELFDSANFGPEVRIN